MIFLLHGFTGAPASFEALQPLLPGPSHALPVLGHGAPGPSAVSFVDEVDRLAAAIAEASVPPHPPRWVVGYSLGGRLALGLACRHPRLLAGVVAVGAHPGLADPLLREERRASDEALAQGILTDGVPGFVDRWQGLPLFASQRALPAPLLAGQRRLRLSHSASGLAWSLRVLGLGAMRDLRPGLARTTVPVHLVTGARDGKFTAIAEGLSCTASHLVVEGAGHNVLLEKPHALAAAIGSILNAAAEAPEPTVELRP